MESPLPKAEEPVARAEPGVNGTAAHRGIIPSVAFVTRGNPARVAACNRCRARATAALAAARRSCGWRAPVRNRGTRWTVTSGCAIAGAATNVCDLSELTREQAEALVFAREGAMCARFYRHSDGTILTSDCPPGRRRYLALRGLFGALVAAVLAIFLPRLSWPKQASALSRWISWRCRHTRPAS